jgi:hypothetical protein
MEVVPPGAFQAVPPEGNARTTYVPAAAPITDFLAASFTVSARHQHAWAAFFAAH